MKDISDFLIEITAAIDKLAPDSVSHGFLGGTHGYGAHYSNPVFTMRPYYWGECDCGAEERAEVWFEANHHAPDCYQSILKDRMAEWERATGYNELEKAAQITGDPFDFMEGETEEVDPGVFITELRPREDAAALALNAARPDREAQEKRVIAELCKRFSLDPHFGCLVHCTCGRDQQAEVADIKHTDACALELPNFRHHSTGAEIRWYKYIGRGMEEKDLPEGAALHHMMAECLESIARPVACGH